MFGWSAKPDPKKEAERQAAERLMLACRDLLKQMEHASPEEAERLGKRLKDGYGGEKRVDFEFRRTMLERARRLECNANMRAADHCLHDAARLAAEEQMMERTKKLGDGRRYAAKAMTLGAGDEFRRASDRLIETIMLTGGVQHKGPTRAKPRDVAPKNPHCAKMADLIETPCRAKA